MRLRGRVVADSAAFARHDCVAQLLCPCLISKVSCIESLQSAVDSQLFGHREDRFCQRQEQTADKVRNIHLCGDRGKQSIPTT